MMERKHLGILLKIHERKHLKHLKREEQEDIMNVKVVERII
jgi:hypothetical protein